MKRFVWLLLVGMLAVTAWSQATVTVTRPNGGETYAVGGRVEIAWTITGELNTFSIAINRHYGDSVSTWENLGTVTGTARTYAWVITGPATTTARIRVVGAGSNTGTTASDISNGNFTITGGTDQPTVTVTRPNGGEVFPIGSSQQITWSATGAVTGFIIAVNRTYPSETWVTIGQAAATARSFTWSVTGEATTTARIRVAASTSSGTTINDISNENFGIASNTIPRLTLTAPNGGERWVVGTTHVITWVGDNSANRGFTLYLYRNYPDSSNIETLGTADATTRVFSWTVTGPVTERARVGIGSDLSSVMPDISDANFAIVTETVNPFINVTRPNGGEIFVVGSTQEITWTAGGLVGDVQVQLSRNFPTTGFETIGGVSATARSYRWLVSGTGTEHARIRVISGVNSGVIVADTSNADFIIRANVEPPRLAVVRPNGSERWIIGSRQEITWSGTDANTGFTIGLLRNYPDSTLEVLGTAAPTARAFAWTVTGPVSERARVFIVSDLNSVMPDISDANFVILNGTSNTPTVTVLAPNGGEVWPLGSRQEVRWEARGLTGGVRILLNRTYPNGEWAILGEAPAIQGVFGWQVSGRVTEAAVIRVVGRLNNVEYGDNSNRPFRITGRNASPSLAPEGEDPLPQNATIIAPNPFNATTTITYQVPVDGSVKLTVMDALGRTITTLASGEYAAGTYRVTFDGAHLSTGIYFLRTELAGKESIRKMVLMK